MVNIFVYNSVNVEEEEEEDSSFDSGDSMAVRLRLVPIDCDGGFGVIVVVIIVVIEESVDGILFLLLSIVNKSLNNGSYSLACVFNVSYSLVNLFHGLRNC